MTKSIYKNTRKFWKTKSLQDMTIQEWELLCDHCGLCCLHKLEDKDTGEIFYTSVACRLLHIDECRCLSYKNRHKLVPDCLSLNPEQIDSYKWLPSTCAYRLIAEGKALRWWHPLVSGDADSVHQAGISLKNKAVSENYVNIDDIEAYILDEKF